MLTNHTLLSRSWLRACTLSLCASFIVQFLMGYDQAFSNQPICQSEVDSNWSITVKAAEFSVFFAILYIVLMYSWLSSSYNRENGVFCLSAVSITVTLIGGCSSLLYLWSGWNGTCQDSFGVKSPVSLIGDLITTFPLIVYTILCMDINKEFKINDIIAFTSSLISVVCLALIQLNIPKPPTIFLLSLALLCGLLMTACLTIPLFPTNSKSSFINIWRKRASTNGYITMSMKGGDANNLLFDTHSESSNQYQDLRRKVTIILLLSLSLFLFSYLVAIIHIVDSELGILLFSLSNIITKLSFVAVLIHVHLEIINMNMNQHQSQTLHMRHVFLRYIMHEVRVPLNSISMGIDLLSTIQSEQTRPTHQSPHPLGVSMHRESFLFDAVQSISHQASVTSQMENHSLGLESKTTHEFLPNKLHIMTSQPLFARTQSSHQQQQHMLTAKETLQMMKDASKAMSDTLDDVLDVQKIEEGMFQLVFNRFNVKELVQDVVHSMKHSLAEKNICVESLIHPQVPAWVKGDGGRIEQILRVLLENGKRNAPENSKISVTVSTLFSNKTMRNLLGHVNIVNTINRRPFSQRVHDVIVPTGPITLQFAVYDHGIGLSEVKKLNLFEPFTYLQTGEHQQQLDTIPRMKSNSKGLHSRNSLVNSLHRFSILRLNENNNNNHFESAAAVARAVNENVKSNQSIYEKRTRINLFVCKQIIERHGGVIECLSQEGVEGNTFRFRVPLQVLPESEENEIELSLRQSSLPRTTSSANGHLSPQINENNKVENNKAQISNNFNSQFSSDTVGVVIRDGSTKMPCVPEEEHRTKKSVGHSPSLETVKESENVKTVTSLHCALVVDDVLACRRLLGCLLQKHGVEYEDAKDGRVALLAVECDITKYQTVFMDNSMPVMTGVEATKSMRGSGYENLIVGVTGNAMEDDIDDFLRAGADIVCAKPLRFDQLQGLLLYINAHGCKMLSSGVKLRLRGNVVEKFRFE